MKVDNPEEAIDEFLGVPALEEEKGDWYVFYRLEREEYEKRRGINFVQGVQRVKTGHQSRIQAWQIQRCRS